MRIENVKLFFFYIICQRETNLLNLVMSPTTDSDQIHLTFVTVLLTLQIFDCHKKQDLLVQRYFTGSMFLLTPTTAMLHVAPKKLQLLELHWLFRM